MRCVGIIIALGILVVVFMMIGSVLNDAKDKGRQVSCAWNLKYLIKASSLYAQDYDSKLPPKTKWSDCVKPYLKSEKYLECSTDANNGISKCSYSFNSKLGRATFTQLKSMNTTPLYFDSRGGWNTFCPVTGAVNRHSHGANYGFADGHAKWIGKRRFHLF